MSAIIRIDSANAPNSRLVYAEDYRKIRLDSRREDGGGFARHAHWNSHCDAIEKLLGTSDREDADGDTLYLARDLEQVSAETLDVLRFPLEARRSMPFSNELMTGAESWSYDMYDVASQCEWVTNWSTPIGGASAGKRRVTAYPYMFGNHYQYTVQDLERAAFAKSKNASNRSLDVEVVRGVRLAHEQFIDRVAWSGDTERGIVGLPGILEAAGYTIGDFADISNVEGAEVQVPYLKPVNKIFTSAVFSGDGPKVVRALNELMMAPGRNTGGLVKATRLLLPLSFQTYMKLPYSNSILDGKSIEAVFLQNNPGVSIDYLYNLDSKSATANSPGGRAIAYFPNPQTFRFILAYDWKEMPVQIVSMAYYVPTYAYILGVVSQRPLQMAQMDLDNEDNA